MYLIYGMIPRMHIKLTYLVTFYCSNNTVLLLTLYFMFYTAGVII